MLVVAISPWLAATFDGFGITLNAIRGFLGLEKAASYIATKIAPVIINGMVNTIATLINIVIKRIFNSIVENIDGVIITSLLNGLTDNISVKPYEEIINFVSMFFSFGSFIAGILDFCTDGWFDGIISI